MAVNQSRTPSICGVVIPGIPKPLLIWHGRDGAELPGSHRALSQINSKIRIRRYHCDVYKGLGMTDSSKTSNLTRSFSLISLSATVRGSSWRNHHGAKLRWHSGRQFDQKIDINRLARSMSCLSTWRFLLRSFIVPLDQQSSIFEPDLCRP